MASKRRRVELDVRLKMSLEDTFKRELRSIFNTVRTEFMQSYIVTGDTQNIDKYRSSFESILDNHYSRTTKAFMGSVANFNDVGLKRLSLFSTKQDETDEELLLAIMLQWREREAPLTAELLTETTRRNIQDAIEQARNQLQDDGQEINNTNLGRSASAIMRRKFNARADFISVSETQRAAEATKLTEAEILSDLQPSVVGGFFLGTSETVKEWRTVGDRRVRDSHRQANGQRQRIDQPFVVQGQLLMHPGDRSLGATADNVANCRCSAIYVIQ